MQSLKLLSVLGLILLGVTSLGCDTVKDAFKDAVKQAEKKQEVKKKDDADTTFGQKLNKYIECINTASSSAFRSKRRYLGWVNAETGPTGQEKNVYGIYQMQNVDQCKKALKEVKGMPPETPELQSAAEEYEKVLDKLVPLVDEAHTYYDGKKHEADKLAKGKQMHGPLMAAFEEFSKADEKMRSKVAEVNDKLALRDLDRIERTEGKKLLWHWKKMMIDAKHLVRAGDAPEFKLDEFSKALKTYEESYELMGSYAKGHDAEVKRVMMFSSAQGDADAYLKAAQAMQKRYQDGTPTYSQSEMDQLSRNLGWMVAGSPDDLVKKYNALINRSNGLRW